MLSTKRVNTYGKRSSRIVHTTNLESPAAQRIIDDENSVLHSPVSTRKLLRWGRKVNGHSTSPRGSPKAANIFKLASSKKSSPVKEGIGCTPQRQPLGLKNNSALNSPPIVYIGTRISQTSHKQPAFAPFVDLTVDAIPEEENKAKNPRKKASKPSERRIKLTEITNVSTTEDEQPVRRPQRKAKRVIVISDSGDGDETDDEADSLQANSRQAPSASDGFQQSPILISTDDDEDRSSDYIPKITRPNSKKETKKPTLPSNAREKSRNNETLPQPQRQFRRAESLRKRMVKDRVSLTDLHIDSSLTEVGELSMSLRHSGRSKRSSRTTKDCLPPELQYLSALLAECSQEAPQSFSKFIESFPSNDTFRQYLTTDLAFRKIGEASYSEVFGIGDVVLKVIPLRNEISCQLLNDDIDWPCESDCKEVLQEIIITREVGKVCPGFIKLLGTFIVIGEYPSSLLDLWDEFNQQKESENIRPGIFTKSQAYALLVLPNGGPDLESYKFPLKLAWRQACSLFWQTAKAIAIAEASVSFEHRDLHWGQILVKPIENSVPKRRLKQHQHDLLPMDHPSYGVSATIIDLGLARMDAVNCKDRVYYVPFDDVIFEGEGDYQFDVYRMIRDVHSDGCWEKYRPITNVIWLHYLTVKLLRQKGLRPPGFRNHVPGTNEFNERRCYQSLVEMESLLGGSIVHLRGKKGRSDRTRTMFSSAGDVVLFAREKGWLI